MPQQTAPSRKWLPIGAFSNSTCEEFGRPSTGKPKSFRPLVNARVSKISLVVFAGMLALSAFLLSIPGDYWLWFAVTSIFAAVPVAFGPSRYRLIGFIALIVSGVLIVNDIAAGKRFRARHPDTRR
jgi:hypothetical protein